MQYFLFYIFSSTMDITAMTAQTFILIIVSHGYEYMV